jgi:hypothetical protein
MNKFMRLPPRKALFGFDYSKNKEFRMTGKEWHAYAKVEEFKTEHGSDSAWRNGCEIYLDGTNINYTKG